MKKSLKIVDLGQEYQAITKSMWLAELSDITDVEIVHNGTFYCNYRVLIDSIKKDGDIVSVDFVALRIGFHGDAGRTYLVGNVS